MPSITLLSDFGLQDATAASAKGILLQHLPATNIVDISHHVTPFNIQQGAYLLKAGYKSLPKGTIHIVLVDIFYNKLPQMAICQYDGHYFIAPDNGILTIAFGEEQFTISKKYDAIAMPNLRSWVHITGEITAKMQENKDYMLGLPNHTLTSAKQKYLPIISPTSIEGQVIHIDRYENVVLNITRQQFELAANSRRFKVSFMRGEEITTISNTYNDVKEGEKLCRFNSSGNLEIAINRGTAASLLGFKLNKEYNVMYNTIKIFFE